MRRFAAAIFPLLLRTLKKMPWLHRAVSRLSRAPGVSKFVLKGYRLAKPDAYETYLHTSPRRDLAHLSPTAREIYLQLSGQAALPVDQQHGPNGAKAEAPIDLPSTAREKPRIWMAGPQPDGRDPEVDRWRVQLDRLHFLTFEASLDAGNRGDARKALLQKILQIPAPATAQDAAHDSAPGSVLDIDRQTLAKAMAHNFPPPRKSKQLFVDVSQLLKFDAKTGIQRVVRSVLTELLHHPPYGYQIEPVFATGQSPGYLYARQFTRQFLGRPPSGPGDDLIEFQSGDVFLGLDLALDEVVAQADFLLTLKRHGVGVQFVVYDLLAIRLPEHFSTEAQARFRAWLRVVTNFDGLLCISATVASELQNWLQAQARAAPKSPAIRWFHLGADIEHSAPSKGSGKDEGPLWLAIQRRPSFAVVSTIEPRKGQEQALKAFELLWKRSVDVNLIFIGQPGWMMEPFIKKLNRHPEKGQRLFWMKRVSDESLKRVYENATALVMPSLGEGFGLPLIEAAQHKLPVIANDIPVFREVAGENAFYLPSLESEAMADRLMDWLALHRQDRHPKSDRMPWLSWKKSVENLLTQLLGFAPENAHEAQ